MSEDFSQQVHKIASDEWPKVAAILTAELKDIGLAEECTQDAFTKAIEQWPGAGVPQRPGAWLLTVARRGAIDILRRNKTGEAKTELVAQLELATSPAATAVDMSLVRDEQLQLLFGCCHPALSVEAQIALTLRCVLGVSTPRIAAAFLVPEATLAQRLGRAKKKIKAAGIGLRMPSDAELLDRTAAVHKIIYLTYNDGYIEEPNRDPTKRLGPEAIRLAQLLAELLADNAETHGLLALMSFLEGRAPARVVDGKLVLLENQDRTLWNDQLIEQGKQSLQRALVLENPGPYQMQAAINELHCAPNSTDTDWRQIAMLYSRLLGHTDTPVIRLNHAVAVGLSETPESGLGLLKSLEDDLASYHYYWAAKGDLNIRAGNSGANDFKRAIELCDNDLERELLAKKLNG